MRRIVAKGSNLRVILHLLSMRNDYKVKYLKGQSQGHNIIFESLKMTFRTKILEKKYTMLISIKNTTKFVLTTFLYDFFFERAPDRGERR